MRSGSHRSPPSCCTATGYADNTSYTCASDIERLQIGVFSVDWTCIHCLLIGCRRPVAPPAVMAMA